MSETELNNAIEKLEIVNENQIDIYLKLLMCSKSKQESEIIRSFVVDKLREFLDENKEIRQRLKNTNVSEYNTEYLGSFINEVNKQKIKNLKASIKEQCKKLLKSFDDDADLLNSLIKKTFKQLLCSLSYPYRESGLTLLDIDDLQYVCYDTVELLKLLNYGFDLDKYNKNTAYYPLELVIDKDCSNVEIYQWSDNKLLDLLLRW